MQTTIFSPCMPLQCMNIFICQVLKGSIVRRLETEKYKEQCWSCSTNSTASIPLLISRFRFTKVQLFFSCYVIFAMFVLNSSLLTSVNADNPQVIAATNRVDILDPALLRSGRLDRKIEFPAPNEEARARIMQIHSRKMNVRQELCCPPPQPYLFSSKVLGASALCCKERYLLLLFIKLIINIAQLIMNLSSQVALSDKLLVSSFQLNILELNGFIYQRRQVLLF